MGKWLCGRLHELQLLSSSFLQSHHFLHPPKDFSIKASTQRSTSLPDDGNLPSSKEAITRHAIHDMNNLGFWICGVLLSGLNADARPYLETKQLIKGFPDETSSLASGLRTFEGMIVRCVISEEVKRVNEAVSRLEAAVPKEETCGQTTAEDLQRELNSLMGKKKKLSNDVNGTFSMILDSRKQLLDMIRNTLI